VSESARPHCAQGEELLKQLIAEQVLRAPRSEGGRGGAQSRVHTSLLKVDVDGVEFSQIRRGVYEDLASLALRYDT